MFVWIFLMTVYNRWFLTLAWSTDLSNLCLVSDFVDSNCVFGQNDGVAPNATDP